MAWYGFIFWITRHREQRTVLNLQPRVVTQPDVAALKTKYLGFIDQVESKHTARKLSARSVHQKLSLLLRYFVYEANGYAAHVMTLSDLKQSRYTKIANAIEKFYPPEFTKVEQGNVASALATAREIIQSW